MTIKEICLCLCTLMFLCACQQQAHSGSERKVSKSGKSFKTYNHSKGGRLAELEKRRKACRNRGGKWVHGRAGGSCASKTKDAGKSCTSSKQCAGFCLANGRVCSPTKPFFGCHKLYENGRTPSICVD